jgi:hypothetical protein
MFSFLLIIDVSLTPKDPHVFLAKTASNQPLLKSYTLIPYRLRDHNIQSQTKSFYPVHPRGITVFWRPKKPFLDIDMGRRTSHSCSYLS